VVTINATSSIWIRLQFSFPWLLRWQLKHEDQKLWAFGHHLTQPTNYNAVTVTASGAMLPSLLVFNAKPNGHVERKLANFPPGAHYSVQKK
jgi:hypothetical protein